ncbi:hypothetical protein AGMMS49938_15010 [Fibrobacterales bacterium]|nr:hypothetical protein AGMMS49938_15010 [Fibrobacterales bacterium]
MFNDSVYNLSFENFEESPAVLCFEVLEGLSGEDYLSVSTLARTKSFQGKQGNALLGSSACFSFEFEGQKEFFCGIVAECSEEPSPKGFSRLTFLIKTQRHLAGKEEKSAVFCETDFLSIFNGVFENSNFKLNSAYNINFCVQYGETDLDFFERLSENNGIFNFAKHNEKKCEIIVADSTDIFESYAPFGEGSSTFNDTFIKTRLERTENGEIFFGYGHKPLRVGAVLNFFDTEFIVCSVFHSGSQESAFGLKGRQDGYLCQVSAIPKKVFQNLPKSRTKPQISGVTLATVEGFSGSFASLDSQGRYSVRMQFDEENHRGAAASSPIYLSQNFAGENCGVHFPLLKGTPVLIAFENGDIDRPIALGALPKDNFKSPVNNKNPNQNILKTAGGIEFVFDDATKCLEITAPMNISIKAGGRLILQGKTVEIN